MDPFLAGAAVWLLQQAVGKVFDLAVNSLLGSMGIASSTPPAPPPLTRGSVQSLLDQYVQRLEKEIKQVATKLDEDRLALLKGALSQLKNAHRTVIKSTFLAQALNAFNMTAHLPEHGTTGKWRNAELRCVAFLGIAAAHAELNDPPQLIAENLVAAIQADSSTAEQWLGTMVVQAILQAHPSLQSQSRSPFPLSWGQLKFDSSVEQVFPGLDEDIDWGGPMAQVYEKQTRTYTLISRQKGVYFADVGDSPKRHGLVPPSFKDFAVQAEMTFPYSRASSGGILFRMENKFNVGHVAAKRMAWSFWLQGYYFSISNDGSYALDFYQVMKSYIGNADNQTLLVLLSGNLNTLPGYSEDVKVTHLAQGAITVTAGTPLQIGCVVQGRHLDLYAYGQRLTQVTDNLRAEGAVGIASGSYENSFVSEVQFRHFQLWTR